MTSRQEEYQKYLQTAIWHTIRRQRLAIDNGECVLCGIKATNVHHRRYPKRLGSETVNDLISLCDTCHSRHHDKIKTEELSVSKLNKLNDTPESFTAWFESQLQDRSTKEYGAYKKPKPFMPNKNITPEIPEEAATMGGFLSILGQKHPAQMKYIRSSIISLDDGDITLTVNHGCSFLFEQLTEPTRLKVLTDTASECFGKPITIRVMMLPEKALK